MCWGWFLRLLGSFVSGPALVFCPWGCFLWRALLCGFWFVLGGALLACLGGLARLPSVDFGLCFGFLVFLVFGLLAFFILVWGCSG